MILIHSKQRLPVNLTEYYGSGQELTQNTRLASKNPLVVKIDLQHQRVNADIYIT